MASPWRTPHGRQRLATAATVVALLPALVGCATTAPAAPVGRPGTVRVVAAESAWGSLAEQLGGRHATVTSIIANPAADPHDYEATVADARIVAGAQLVIVNGVGYDPWAGKLVRANDSPGQLVITVGTLTGTAADGNPHRWYDPADVTQVVHAITADLRRLDPAHAGYFAGREKSLLDRGMADYFATIAQIRQRYVGTPVGASESVVAPLAAALGLRLRTPDSFLRAVSEGADPTTADKTTVDRQLTDRQIAVYVYNSQNATPDVSAELALARAHDIPTVRLTETLTPAGATFQDWQVRQLRAIRAALAQATRR